MVLAKTILHYPRLDTVLMVEDAIRESKNYPGKLELWNNLPKRVMYQTFCVVIDYLLQSNKIILTKDKKLKWIFANTLKTRKLLERSVES
ncbi:MAG: hypothetical protein NTY48_05010 [Candidatus Diapherotrites archaeon]|nr:hypothetical protein [Candidatus Diapherotrites archaeon]